MDLTSFFKERSPYLEEILLSPPQIVRELDRHVIGQDQAKRTLAQAAFLRSIRILYNRGRIKLTQPLRKNNILLIGNTGTGKTQLIKSLGIVLDTIITRFDCTSLTSSGYMGTDVDAIIEKHMQNSSHSILVDKQDGKFGDEFKRDIERAAAFGILYLDEFDKCRKTGENNSSGRDINGQSVQQELLKVLDGEDVLYGSRHNGPQKLFNTQDLLCICGGAFVGLDDVILDRLNKNEGIGIGFMSEGTKTRETYNNVLEKLTNEDLIAYGYMPEILGRLNSYAVLQALTEDQLCLILTNVEQSIVGEFKSYFQLFGIDLSFEKDALKEIAKMAKERAVGARGLKSIVTRVLEDYQYNILELASDQKLVITKETIRNGAL